MSSSFLTRLARHLDLHVDELKRALVLAVLLGSITGSYTLVKTVRDAHFLSVLSVSWLPYVYLGVGVLSVAAAALVTRFTRRAATWESLSISSMVAAVSLAAFGQIFRIQRPWVTVSFYLWTNVYGVIVVSQFWSFANSVSNPREARRTFSLIGLGGILGGLIGGLIATPLARFWSLTSILDLAAVLQALAVQLVRVGGRRTEAVAEELPSSEEAVPRPLAHPYVRWLALGTLCSVMVSGVLDYQFKAEMQRRFALSSEYVSFLGMFYTVTNLAAFGVQALGTRWMIQRLGASWSSSLLPAGLGVTTSLTVLFPGFATVAAGRVWDQVTRLSVGQSAGELFYFPLDPGLRRRAKSFIGSGLERLGDGFAGVLILAAGFTVGATTRSLALLSGLLLLVWAFAWLRIRRGYVAELGVNLRRMNLRPQHSRMSLREAGILREMEGVLGSSYERVVIQGIDLLAENDPDRIEPLLQPLLDHPSARVRARALQVVRGQRLRRYAGAVEQLIHDQDPEVQVQALSTYCAFAESDVFESLQEYLRSPNPRVRVAAILSLIEQTPARDEGKLKDVLDGLLRSGNLATRVAVSEGLGRRPGPSELHDMLGPLLIDEELPVRRAAIRSAGKAARRSHIPILIDALGAPLTEDAAREALVSLGDRVVGTLGDYLSDSTVELAIRQAIPRALADMPMQESVNALFRYRDFGDVRLAYRVLKASNRLRASGARLAFPHSLVTEDIERDVGSHLFAMVHRRALPPRQETRAEQLLAIVLQERVDQSLNRVFRRLGLIYSSANITAAYLGVTSLQPRPKANAIEYLENALAPEHRALVMPLVDERDDADRVRLAAQRFGIQAGTYEYALGQILRSDDTWLRACSLYVVGVRRERALLPLVESNLSTFNVLVRETASWARLAIAAGL